MNLMKKETETNRRPLFGGEDAASVFSSVDSSLFLSALNSVLPVVMGVNCPPELIQGVRCFCCLSL